MLCDSLSRSERARRTAWRVLQRIRQVLQTSTAESIPPPSPRTFEREGKLLVAEMANQVIGADRRIAELQAAIKGIRPFLKSGEDSARFPHALLRLNRATDWECLSEEQIQSLQKLARDPGLD